MLIIKFDNEVVKLQNDFQREILAAQQQAKVWEMKYLEAITSSDKSVQDKEKEILELRCQYDQAVEDAQRSWREQGLNLDAHSDDCRTTFGR